MPRAKKANIRPELIGELFTDGQEYFKLISCETEPNATLSNIAWQSPTGQVITKPISQFAGMIHLTPDRKIEIKQERKPRSDKGKNRKQASITREVLTTNTDIEPISTSQIYDSKAPTSKVTVKLSQDGGEHTVIIKGLEGKGKTLKEATSNALEHFGGTIPDDLSKYDKKLLEGMLNPTIGKRDD